jgi:hypothetical protein
MDFWSTHGFVGGCFFLLFLTLLPRTTTVIALALPVGIWAWTAEPFGLGGHPLGFLIAIAGWILWFSLPRFLIAVIASLLYWNENPILCFTAWGIACFMHEMKHRFADEIQQVKAYLWQGGKAEKGEAETRDTREEPPPAHAPPRPRAKEWWEDILGVSPDASVDTIRTAYTKVAKKTHPDLNPNMRGNPEAFRRAHEAYQAALRCRGKNK